MVDNLRLPGYGMLTDAEQTNNGNGLDMVASDTLDFHDGGYWGDDLSNLWVTAAAPGTVVVHSSCNMEIIHDNGFSTQHYHLDNIQYSNGDSVSRDANIANYASERNQALCQGGSSTGPHLHFSLFEDADNSLVLYECPLFLREGIPSYQPCFRQIQHLPQVTQLML
jgi:murein DD-endopeptidase MepM/ murein hydrolase activator NlpD